mmetsp:Transcript_8502/g.23853  ORF Transcript_8502/g.23853 Transcript_8502/m.23853 type:complete len:290 (-) Transcript_8502:306-1175(-)
MCIGGRDPEFKESLVDKAGLIVVVAFSSCEHVDFVPPDPARGNCACADERGVIVVALFADVLGVGGSRLTPKANDLILTTPLPPSSPVFATCVPLTPIPVASTNASVPPELTERKLERLIGAALPSGRGVTFIGRDPETVSGPACCGEFMLKAHGFGCILLPAEGEEFWEPLVVPSGLAVSIVPLVMRMAFVLSSPLEKALGFEPAPPAAAGEITVSYPVTSPTDHLLISSSDLALRRLMRSRLRVATAARPRRTDKTAMMMVAVLVPPEGSLDDVDGPFSADTAVPVG